MKRKLYHEPWKIFANKYLYTVCPSTPSRGDIRIIESYLKKILKINKKPNILILGCTVNYRKLLAKYRLLVNLVDINKIMYEANTSMIKDIKRKERFILDNWLTMKMNKKYDLILGDFVVNNISLRDRDKFFKNIKKHLSDSGLFITRVYFQPKIFLKPGEFFMQYKNKRATRRTLTELWWDAIFQLGFDTKTGILDNRKGYLGIKRLSKDYSHMKRWLKLYEERLPSEDKIWAVLTEKEQLKEIQKHFNCKAVKFANDYKYWEICPTYILTR